MEGLLVSLGVIGLYFVPLVIAVNRGHPSALPIAILNVLLGWTLLGWAVALVWSLRRIGSEPRG